MAAELKLTVSPVANSQDAAKNTSRVQIKLVITTSYGTYNLTGSTSGNIKLNGAQIASLAGKKVQKDTTTTLYNATRTVQHNADGTAEITVKAAFDVETSVRWIYAEKTVTLPPILRSSLTAQPLELGEEGTLTVHTAAKELEHEVRYTFGEATGVAVERTAQTDLRWTPPLDLAEQIPDSSSGEVTLTLVSWSGDTEVGQSQCTTTLTLPRKYHPTATLETVLENDNTVLAGWKIAVKGRSRLRYTAAAEPSPGARLTKAEFAFGHRRSAALSGTIDLAEAGRLRPSFTVADSRGRNAAVGLMPLTVYDYAAPCILTAEAVRCDSAGAPVENGNCAQVRCTARYSALEGRNRLTLRCRRRVVGGSWGEWTELTDGQSALLTGFDPAHSYEVAFHAADTVGEEDTAAAIVPTEAVSFALADGGESAGFGKYPEQPGLDMGWDIHMNGHSITGLPAPRSDSDATPWGRVNFDRIYPVGSLYLTLSDADPAQLFGGTWQPIRDVFLLAAGGSYGLGDTGGEAAHTLTVGELPAHRHATNGVPTQLYSGGYAAMRSAEMSQQSSTTGYTTQTGGGEAHNNMPPYLAVNVWQRTA